MAVRVSSGRVPALSTPTNVTIAFFLCTRGEAGRISATRGVSTS